MDDDVCPNCEEYMGEFADIYKDWHVNSNGEYTCPHCRKRFTLRKEVSICYLAEPVYGELEAAEE